LSWLGLLAGMLGRALAKLVRGRTRLIVTPISRHPDELFGRSIGEPKPGRGLELATGVPFDPRPDLFYRRHGRSLPATSSSSHGGALWKPREIATRMLG